MGGAVYCGDERQGEAQGDGKMQERNRTRAGRGKEWQQVNLHARLDYIAGIWILLLSDEWVVGWVSDVSDKWVGWWRVAGCVCRPESKPKASHMLSIKGKELFDQVVSSPSSLSLLPGTIVIISGCSDD